MLRTLHYGLRGKAKFAQALGIRRSSYAHYEIDRVPPAEILLRAARVTRTRLEWLISGEGEASEPVSSPTSQYADRLAARLRTILHAHPELIPQGEVFLGLLSQLHETVTGPAQRATQMLERPGLDHLVPIVGSTSAGTARYWHELPDSTDGPVADAQLESRIAQCTEPTVETAAQFGQTTAEGVVSLVQLSEPDQRGVIEFLAAPEFKAAHPRCVAWRIDGDSMAPRYCDGDFVLTSPLAPAENGYACVARQAGQLGVNCKLFRQVEDTVWLIPVNANHPTQVLPRAEIVWAWRVLASVRVQGWMS
ncbi:MAG: S24 family peptidase [Planctomycetaceae bacterium]